MQLLKGLHVPADYSARYKTIQDDMLKCNEHTDVQPYVEKFQSLLKDILKDYSDCMQLVDKLKSAPQDEKKPGLFGKLFGGSQSSEQATQVGTDTPSRSVSDSDNVETAHENVSSHDLSENTPERVSDKSQAI